MSRDPNTGKFLPKSKRAAAMRTAASSIGRIFRGNPRTLTREEHDALAGYAARHGRNWKASLRADWSRGTDLGAALRRVRNSFGPSWLASFSFARVNPSKKRPARKASPKRASRKAARRPNPRGGTLYAVTIRNLSSGATTSATMRSPTTETERELYTRAVKKLRGRGFWFHPDLPGHPNIGRIASQARGGGTDLHERVRIDTERA